MKIIDDILNSICKEIIKRGRKELDDEIDNLQEQIDDLENQIEELDNDKAEISDLDDLQVESERYTDDAISEIDGSLNSIDDEIIDLESSIEKLEDELNNHGHTHLDKKQ